jgi:hypothetical protein
MNIEFEDALEEEVGDVNEIKYLYMYTSIYVYTFIYVYIYICIYI